MSKRTEASNATRLKRVMNYTNRMDTVATKMKRDRELGFAAGYAGLPMPKGMDKWYEIYLGYEAGRDAKKLAINTDPATPPNSPLSPA